MPDDNTVLYVWLWSFNGTTAPASTTTWTIGFVSVEKFASLPVYLQGARANGAANAFPVTVQGTAAVSIATNTPTLAAGTNLAADFGVQYRASATGAASFANMACPATPAPQAIKAGAGRLLGFALTNDAASTRWVKLWNTAAGSVTMGTTAALAEIAIPSKQTITINLDGGIGFSTAITAAVTGGQGLSNNTAVTSGDVTGLAFFA